MSDDRAGYKRPPMATRFRPGESGNPSGRPKRCPSFRETLLARLAAPAGGARHGNTKMQALVATLVDAAISGDARAQALVLGALTRFGESAEHEALPLSANDQEIVEAYVGSEPVAIDSAPAASETGGDEMAAGEERSDSGTK
jgi:hypothetical protein